jgi:acyl-ACP thioesterase
MGPPDISTPATEPPELVPLPASGRTFTVERRVRWGDTDTTGRLRLDALARFLQDVANDDTRDAGHDPFAPWIVRRTTVVVEQDVALGELVSLTTFSGGHGSRWAERRTSVVGDGGGRIETAALWVYVDPVTGRPARLTPEFHAAYDEAGGGRTVTARLRHDPPPVDGSVDVARRPWTLRASDLDQLGHVNNAATWEAVEDEVSRRGIVPAVAEIEYPDAIDPADDVELVSTQDASTGVLRVWLVVGGAVRASATVRAR